MKLILCPHQNVCVTRLCFIYNTHLTYSEICVHVVPAKSDQSIDVLSRENSGQVLIVFLATLSYWEQIWTVCLLVPCLCAICQLNVHHLYRIKLYSNIPDAEGRRQKATTRSWLGHCSAFTPHTYDSLTCALRNFLKLSYSHVLQLSDLLVLAVCPPSTTVLQSFHLVGKLTTSAFICINCWVAFTERKIAFCF